MHGIASPNRRPTIFDVFRPRAKSDAKKQKMLLDPLSAAAVASGNEMGSASSTHSATGGTGGTGVMNSMKVALQNSGLIGGGHHQKQQQQHPAVTITTAEGTSVKNKYKDGSAHPHQGSDAHVSVKYFFELFVANINRFSVICVEFSFPVLSYSHCGAKSRCHPFAHDQGDGFV